MLRRLKPFLFVSVIFILFSLLNLWLKQYVFLQKILHFDSKSKFLFQENIYKININNVTSKVRKSKTSFQTLSRNLNTITETTKDLLSTSQKDLKLNNQTSILVSSSNLVYKSPSPEILFENIDRLKTNSSRFKLVVLVSTHALHTGRRKLIRYYWGNHSRWTTPFQWKVIFVTGFFSSFQKIQLHAEADTYKDTLIESVEEDFYTLSFKVMLGLKWVQANLKYDFLLKCDDDVFVNIDRLMRLLLTTRDQYFGHKMEFQPVEREGRYGVSVEEHPGRIYDPFCSGGGFVLSHLTVSRMIPFFNWVNPLKIDDAYIGKIVTKAGIKAIHYGGFSMYNFGCLFEKHLIVSHPVKEKRCMKLLMRQCMILNGKFKSDA